MANVKAGSTCFEIIPFLCECKDLTIIVNSLYLVTRLGAMTQHKVVLIGDEYRSDRMDLTGRWMEAARGKGIRMIYPRDSKTMLAASQQEE